MAQHVTFFKMKVQPGKLDELTAMMSGAEEEARLRELGWQMSVVGTRKNNADEVWGCVTWDTSERYYANAESPEQHERFLKFMEYAAAEPEWHDGEIVLSYLP